MRNALHPKLPAVLFIKKYGDNGLLSRKIGSLLNFVVGQNKQVVGLGRVPEGLRVGPRTRNEKQVSLFTTLHAHCPFVKNALSRNADFNKARASLSFDHSVILRLRISNGKITLPLKKSRLR